MKYPRLNDFVEFIKVDEDKYEILNAEERTNIFVNEDEIEFLTQLNGKRNPYKLVRVDRKYLANMLRILEQQDILHKSRFEYCSIFFGMVPLISLRNVAKKHPNISKICKVLSIMIMLLSMPSLGFGIYRYFLADFYINSNIPQMIIGLLLGALLGITLHETGHLISGFAYGANITHVGVAYRFFIPMAYVHMSQKGISRLKMFIINVSGVLMNFIIFGTIMLFYNESNPLSPILSYAGVSNLMLGLVNLNLGLSLDGRHCIENLIGDDMEEPMLNKITKSKRTKRVLKEKGPNGTVLMAASYMLRSFNILLPIVIVTSEVMGVILWKNI